MAEEPEQAPAVDVPANLAEVRRRISEACVASDRDPCDVTLIAVSKGQPLERIEAALAAGQRLFGENYVQEAASRWPELRSRYPDVEVHMIGALQSNKARDAIRLFDALQTVDREKLARELAREFDKQDRRLPIFIEVNTGDEPQKAGVPSSRIDAFVRFCREELALPIEGLMAIPPEEENVSLHAALLKKLAMRNGLSKVSIGMSADYETAIRFGATHVRVGSAIFGARARKRDPSG